MAALVRRDYDGWIKPVLPWVVFSTAILATGFIMGGVWAYKVLGWGGYWGWDPVENGSLIPWLSNVGAAARTAGPARDRVASGAPTSSSRSPRTCSCSTPRS